MAHVRGVVVGRYSGRPHGKPAPEPSQTSLWAEYQPYAFDDPHHLHLARTSLVNHCLSRLGSWKILHSFATRPRVVSAGSGVRTDPGICQFVHVCSAGTGMNATFVSRSPCGACDPLRCIAPILVSGVHARAPVLSAHDAPGLIR